LVREDKPKLYRTIEEIVQTIVKVSATKARGAYEPFVFKDCKVAYVLPGFDVTQDVSLGDDEKMKLIVFIKEPARSRGCSSILGDRFGPQGCPNTNQGGQGVRTELGNPSHTGAHPDKPPFYRGTIGNRLNRWVHPATKVESSDG